MPDVVGHYVTYWERYDTDPGKARPVLIPANKSNCTNFIFRQIVIVVIITVVSRKQLQKLLLHRYF